mgnify:CR=1 FL=1
MTICVLCHEDLDKYPTNLEHYVHQVLIRNFGKLGIPEHFEWARRRDEQTKNGIKSVLNDILLPIKDHKEWATVRVHTQCNSDASVVAQDFKYIIDNLDHYEDIPAPKFKRIIKYYANLWHVDPYHISLYLYSKDECADRYAGKDSAITYAPYILSCGRIEVIAKEYSSLTEEDKIRHTIRLGTKEALEQI